MSLFRELVDAKLVRILDVFLGKPDELFHIHTLSAAAKVPATTTFRILPVLVKLNIIEIHTVGKLKLYKLRNAKAHELRKVLA